MFLTNWVIAWFLLFWDHCRNFLLEFIKIIIIKLNILIFGSIMWFQHFTHIFLGLILHFIIQCLFLLWLYHLCLINSKSYNFYIFRFFGNNSCSKNNPFQLFFYTALIMELILLKTERYVILLHKWYWYVNNCCNSAKRENTLCSWQIMSL